jgi:putative membrane protein
MVKYDNKNWLGLLFTFNGSIIRSIILRIVLFSTLSAVFVALHQRQIINLKDVSSIPWTLVGVALGLLLVFRTNASYDRYWEGRKQWGGILVATRALSMGIFVYLAPHPDAAAVQQRLNRLLIAFPILLKQRLRQTEDWHEVERFFSPADQQILAGMSNPVAAILPVMASILGQCVAHGMLTEQRLTMLNTYLIELSLNSTGCERIRNTPLPIAYVLHLKRFLTLFCLTISLPLVAGMGWWSVLVTAMISYSLIGIEEIGVEIEDPFGDDPNDLPIDEICATIEKNLIEFARLAELTATPAITV